MANGVIPNRADVLGAYENLLSSVTPTFSTGRNPGLPVESAAFYDFAFYEYAFEIDDGYTGGLSDRGLAVVDVVQNEHGYELAGLLLQGLTVVERIIRTSVDELRSADWDADQVVNDLLSEFYAQATHVAIVLHVHRDAYQRGFVPQFLAFLGNVLRLYLRALISQHYPNFIGFWTDWDTHFTRIYLGWQAASQFELPEPPRGTSPPGGGFWLAPPASREEQWKYENERIDRLLQAYPYDVARSGSINLGLRLVYRQEWMPLGVQPGEILKTVPLGPGQKERVSTKIIRRRKRTTTQESLRETETSQESTDNNKDSSEVVREAARSFNWNVEAEASGGIGFVSASVSSSVGGESSSNSKRQSSQLSESMRKTASKVRNETKVVVSTEFEETFEFERSSEIVNENNESAVTYEYMTLQQQVEVFTHLAEIQPIIYIAEPLPLPDDIDAVWVRENDTAIARVLRDESYRVTLNELIQDIDVPEDPNADNLFMNGMMRAVGSFASFSSTSARETLSIPDIYSEPQKVYQDWIAQRRERARQRELRRVREERLFQHIRKNVLHYCKAIWAEEPSDQRVLRYKRMGLRMPIEWHGPAGSTDAALFRPTGREAEVWELIDPTGPLAYIGNYAVFQLRVRELDDIATPAEILAAGGITIGLSEFFTVLRNPYINPDTSALMDPARRLFLEQAQRLNINDVRARPDAEIYDFVSYLPWLRENILDGNGNVVRDANGRVQYAINAGEWGEYLYRKNNTRRFLLDSNNVYLNVTPSGGAALEPFKRAHRLVDVLQAYEEMIAGRLRNQRRANLIAEPREFDPDIDKVVIVGDGATAKAAAGAEVSDDPEPSADPVGPA